MTDYILIVKLKLPHFYQLVSSTLIFLLILSSPFKLLGAQNNYQTFEVKITNNKVTGELKTLKTSQDQTIDILWNSDKTVTLHIHGYDILINLDSGQPKRTTLRASITGRFPISIHKHKKSDRNHRNILYLEVHPR